MKTTYIIFALALLPLFTNCNKEKKMMKNLEGNWNIETSEKSIVNPNGSEDTYETVSNAGRLIVSQGDGSSDDIMNYDFLFTNGTDTMHVINKLVTDEYKTRLIMLGGVVDSTGARNLVWTIEKEKKNKQVWSVYGVDSTFFYPSNNLNPGAAGNWAVWRITLKRQD